MAGKPSGPALRSLRALFSAGTIGGLTDGQLLERFTARDDGAEPAFAGLVDRHGPMVLRVCRSVLRDAHDAEDAFQATFLILAIKAGSIRGRNSLSSWLYSVAYNVAATARTSAARRRSHEERAGRARPIDYNDPARDDLGPLIHEEFDRLPERYRAVLVLCLLEGLTQHQAAERLGWPVGTVQSRLARGREKLRARLTRRGLAPSAVVLAAPVSVEAIPTALADSTVRLALTIGGAMAIGTVPAAVMHLVKEGARTMWLNKLMTTGAAVLLAVGAIAGGTYAYQAARPAEPATKQAKPAADDPDDGMLTVTGVVRMPDGAPAAGATLRAIDGLPESPLVARADEAGRFELRGVFGGGCALQASSADGSFQAVRRIAAGDVRAVNSNPVELTLRPAIEHEVVVLSGGKPVADARLTAFIPDLGMENGVTGQDGKARLRLPADAGFSHLVAWHPTRGAAGKGALRGRLPGDTTELSLLSPAPLTVHVIDPDGKPVSGLELGVSFHPEDSDWIITQYSEASHVRTNVDGTAIVPWAPGGKIQYVEVELSSSEWKLDETDLKQINNRLITVHARREHAVQGRLIIPEGADAGGILVTGFGFGPSNMGSRPVARARRDGTFTLRVPSNHGFALGIVDSQWAADPWTGLILASDSARPAEITMKVYPATPVAVRVTRGKQHEPVTDAAVEIESTAEVNWTDDSGKKRSGSGGVGSWLTTDADGLARTSMGKGKLQLTLNAGAWRDERTIEVTSEKPVEVEFHRAWTGAQKATVRLTLDGKPYQPSPMLAVHGWSYVTDRHMIPEALEPVRRPDGAFEVAFDAETATLFFLDRERRLSGYAERVKGDADVDVAMTPTAVYAGTLLGVDGQPVADRPLQMYVKASDDKPIATQQTDEAGRFQFTVVPTNVPLQFSNRRVPGDPEDYIFDRDRLFNPGEVRENATLKLQRSSSSSTPPPPVAPLANRVESLCRKVGPSGMRALVAIMGDDSGDSARTVDSLFDYNDDRMRAVLSYLTLRVDPAQLVKEAATIAGLGWPSPKPGEVVLVAIEGDRKTIAAERIAVKKIDAAIAVGAEFIKRHRPPSHDAPTMLAEARAEAKRTARRVWVIEDGPRCGPCFQLARWIEDHRADIEKDYVVVKLMAGVDARVPEALVGLPIETGDGLPWFAITEPDGAVLAHSRGPLGNIGFPSNLEGVRHFRSMLEQTVRKMTSADVERLAGSLAPD